MLSVRPWIRITVGPLRGPVSRYAIVMPVERRTVHLCDPKFTPRSPQASGGARSCRSPVTAAAGRVSAAGAAPRAPDWSHAAIEKARDQSIAVVVVFMTRPPLVKRWLESGRGARGEPRRGRRTGLSDRIRDDGK